MRSTTTSVATVSPPAPTSTKSYQTGQVCWVTGRAVDRGMGAGADWACEVTGIGVGAAAMAGAAASIGAAAGVAPRAAAAGAAATIGDGPDFWISLAALDVAAGV